MSGKITISNRQDLKPIRLRAVQELTRSLLRDELRLAGYDLGVFIVDDPQMTWLNETHLGHAGSTDVITFDYGGTESLEAIHGEIFVCVPEAERQAEHFGVTWEQELMRYMIHGVLHLCGFDDDTPRALKAMKRVENKLVHVLDERMGFGSISPARRPTQRPVDRHRAEHQDD